MVISNNTLLDEERLQSIIQQIKETEDIPGDVIEVGVYKGGSLKVIAEAVAGTKQVWGFDTFTGIPHKCRHDDHAIGDFADTSLAEVTEFLKPHLPKLVSGIFPQEEDRKAISQVSFAHFDADTFESTTKCLDFLLNGRMPIGGIVVLDDYNWYRCAGVTMAIHGFLHRQGADWAVHKRVPIQISLRREK